MFEFISPQNIYHGNGALDKLDSIVKELNVKKLTIITDPVLKEIGVIDNLLKRMENLEVAIQVIPDVVPEPSLVIGNKIVDQTREFNPDLVVGIGGGSALDLAKAAAVLGKNSGKVENYLNLSGDKELMNSGVPKVLIPTTSGTGAEVTDIAVFSLETTKDVITHKFLLADYAIVDPKLTLSLPSRVTAASGIDALTHAIESYTSINATPFTERLSLEAIELIVNNIRTAVWNGQDLHAREQMSLGSLLAGLSFYNAGVAGVHGLAYPLGGLFKLPHGESNAVLLPYVYDFIWPSCLKKMLDIAKVFNISFEGKNEREVVIDLVQDMLYLVEDVGLPVTIKEYNIKKEDIDSLVGSGLEQTRLLNRSPKKLTKESIETIYKNAYNGKLMH